jgi:hypothetical protein
MPTITKTKKNQPNQNALIHLWCNGVNTEMVCPASVSSCPSDGGSAVFSYRAKIAERREHGNQSCFVVSSHQYSVTTSKHQSRVQNGIPLPFRLSHFDFSSEFDSFEKAEQFRLWERRFSERIQDKQLSLVFTAPSRHVGFDKTFYGELIKEVQRQVDEIANPRVKRFGRCSVWEIYTEYLLAEVFRRKFCKGEKKQSVKNIKKIIGEYLCRIERKEAREAAKRVEYHEKVKRLVTLYADEFQKYYEDIMGIRLRSEQNWKDGGSMDDAYGEMRKLGNGLRERIANVQKVNLSDLVTEWEDRSGVTFRYHVKTTWLRLTGEDIETSLGARLPVTLCKALWKRHGGKVQDAEKKLPVEGLPIAFGNFNWTSAADGNLKVGCHVIPASEIIALAARLDW